MVRRLLALVLVGLASNAGCLHGSPSDPVATGETASSETSATTSTSSSESATSTSSASSATTQGEGTSTSTGTGTGASVGSTTTCSFIACDDAAQSSDFECDINLQDCPEGEKCNMWANDGGSSWNATKCVPVAVNPDGVGESCTVEESGVSGIDSCEEGAICWDVDHELGEGTCTAYCVGSWEDGFECPDGYQCRGSRWITLCSRLCDPLAQDCPGDDLCLPSGDGFGCQFDGSGEGGAYGDPCEYVNGCDKGLLCLNAEYVPKCEFAGCCSPLCDTSAANTCPGEEQVCIPWWDEGMAPQGYEDIGVCGLPS